MVPVLQSSESRLPANARQAGRSQKVNGRSGQALIEFALVAVMLLLVLFGVIDFSRIILDRLVMINVSREGANLISRGTDMTNALNALVTSAYPLNINSNGYIILSSVYNNSGVLKITSQKTTGGKPAVSHVGSTNTTVTLPNPNLPLPNQTLYVAEVFYTFTPVTPLGALLGITLPMTNYDAAFF
jgi:Flp pilus assembly protein TadG